MAKKDYIEREAALLAIMEDGCNVTNIPVLMNLPAADVVKVVRCKDCQYWDKAMVNEKGFLICPASGMDITSDDFCSYGERKDGA